ncbi:MAG: Holliday junction branch migration protein RuvA, partial [Acidobacteria bacterium]|nr:Holliday junction branch migration protein RuvA [Acidobacteriota bacterium]NIQ85830.1 Holliday junction branch migration protein RuvA [Acidobacteriota bacterium]
HTHVRAEALQLYGFARLEERRTFELLISISGVGPRMALAFLSGIGVEELAAAVRDGDRARLQRIPGVGKKTAERVLLELADRIDLDGGVGTRPAAAKSAAA